MLLLSLFTLASSSRHDSQKVFDAVAPVVIDKSEISMHNFTVTTKCMVDILSLLAGNLPILKNISILVLYSI